MVQAKSSNPRTWQNRAYLAGVCLGLAVLTFTVSSKQAQFHAKGPMNTGHETLACGDCHAQAPGNFRQQVQAKLNYALGLRETPATFGRKPVGNGECLACHERPNDRHPVYRFLEPRFAKAREALHPQECIACHAEHQGKRVSLATVGFCQQCHQDTKLKKDPLDTSHAVLIEQRRWESCLGCHDFHGNHIMKTATTVSVAMPAETLRDYFGDHASPYGDRLHHRAKRSPNDG